MRTVVPLVVLATLCPAGLDAQRLRLDLIPTAGYHTPREDLGAVARIGSAWYASLDRPDASATLGATAEISRPGRSLGARISGFFTLPAGALATFHCRPGLACPSILLESRAEITTANLLADVVVDLWNTGPLRQWLAMGAGLRHYDISWDAPAVLVDGGSHSETIPAIHVGVGIDVAVGPGALRAAIGGLWSPEGDRVPPAEHSSVPAPGVAGRLAQRDLLVSLGWRIARF